MVIIFIALICLALFFLTGFIVLMKDGEESAIFLLLPVAVLVLVSIYLPIQRIEEFPIDKPEIVFNSNGAILAFEKSNHTFKEFAEVECLRNGTVVPVNQKKYNFYNCEAYSEVVLKPLDKSAKK